ncbi:MAG: hypothetical protein ACP5XB_27165 [Isosphaeraceae bacterium]
MPNSPATEALFVRLYLDRHIVARQLGSREYGTLLGRMLRLLNDYTAKDLASNMVHLEQFK